MHACLCVTARGEQGQRGREAAISRHTHNKLLDGEMRSPHFDTKEWKHGHTWTGVCVCVCLKVQEDGKQSGHWAQAQPFPDFSSPPAVKSEGPIFQIRCSALWVLYCFMNLACQRVNLVNDISPFKKRNIITIQLCKEGEEQFIVCVSLDKTKKQTR